MVWSRYDFAVSFDELFQVLGKAFLYFHRSVEADWLAVNSDYGTFRIDSYPTLLAVGNIRRVVAFCRTALFGQRVAPTIEVNSKNSLKYVSVRLADPRGFDIPVLLEHGVTHCDEGGVLLLVQQFPERKCADHMILGLPPILPILAENVVSRHTITRN